MSETYPNSGRNLPEIETLAGIVLAGREPDFGHGKSLDRSGFEALGLAVPAPSVTLPTAAAIARIERKRRRNPRNWGFLAVVAPPLSGRPDRLGSVGNRKPWRPVAVRRSPVAGVVAGVDRKVSRSFRASSRRASATTGLEATTNRKRRSRPFDSGWCRHPSPPKWPPTSI